MVTDVKLPLVPTRKLTDLTRKENRKQVLSIYYKTRISITVGWNKTFLRFFDQELQTKILFHTPCI